MIGADYPMPPGIHLERLVMISTATERASENST